MQCPGPLLLFPQSLGVSDGDEKGVEGVVYIMYLVGRELGVEDRCVIGVF